MSAPTLFPPFRAEHIGSLKRPQNLLTKRTEFDSGACSKEELEKLEDEAISNIVQMQRDAGIKAMTDGEFRRHMFFDGVFDNLDGMKYISPVPKHMFKLYVPDIAAFAQLDFKGADTYVCTGKLRRTKPFYGPQFEGLKKLTRPEEHKNLKITICAPEWFHLRHGEYAYDLNVYKTDDEYFDDIAIAYQQEIQDLYDRGCRNIQFDDPLLAYFCAESMIQGMEEQGVDHVALLDTYIRAYNKCIEKRPKDMTIGLHLCRGNFKDGRHFSEGGYDRIAARLFKDINVDCYYLEYDTHRAGTFQPLKLLPKNKTVVLGLVSSKLPQLEDPQELRERVFQAARLISEGEPARSYEEALNQICISPQCGFASHSEGNQVSEADVAKKLALVASTAKSIWPNNA